MIGKIFGIEYVKKTGKVIDSRPFQKKIWLDTKIMNLKDLKVGSKVLVICPGSDEVRTLNYKIKKITEK